MLYRLSYSLGGYPTEGSGPGNSSGEAGRMRLILWLVVGLRLVVAGAPAVAQATAEPASAPPAVLVAQAVDGTILLSGSVAEIHGTRLRWEPHEKKRTLGFWTKAEDFAAWTFSVHTPGSYDIEVLQGCGAGQGGSEMVVTLDPHIDTAQTARFIVEDTGGFQEFRSRTVGRFTLASGDHVLRIKPERIAKQAACDIRQIRLVPAE